VLDGAHENFKKPGELRAIGEFIAFAAYVRTIQLKEIVESFVRFIQIFQIKNSATENKKATEKVSVAH